MFVYLAYAREVKRILQISSGLILYSVLCEYFQSARVLLFGKHLISIFSADVTCIMALCILLEC